MEGRLDSASFVGTNGTIKLINRSYTLWSHLASQEPCLPQIPFSITLPSTFQDGDKSSALPPSYQIPNLNLLVRSTYQLHFIITRVRYPKFDIWPMTMTQQYVYFLTSVSVLFLRPLLQHRHPFQICTSNTRPATYSRYSLLFLIHQNIARGMASGSDVPPDAPRC